MSLDLGPEEFAVHRCGESLRFGMEGGDDCPQFAAHRAARVAAEDLRGLDGALFPELLDDLEFLTGVLYHEDSLESVVIKKISQISVVCRQNRLLCECQIKVRNMPCLRNSGRRGMAGHPRWNNIPGQGEPGVTEAVHQKEPDCPAPGSEKPAPLPGGRDAP